MTNPGVAKHGGPAATRRRARCFRIAAGVVLLLGLAGAGAVYWLGSRPPDVSEDPAMVGYDRSVERQMESLYGKQGQLMEDVDDSLKQPGTQAMLMVAATVVAAAGCFQFARVLESESRAEENASNLPAARRSD